MKAKIYYFLKKENSLGRGYQVFIVYYYPKNPKLAWDKISQIPIVKQTDVASRTPAKVRQISKSHYSLEKISS